MVPESALRSFEPADSPRARTKLLAAYDKYVVDGDFSELVRGVFFVLEMERELFNGIVPVVEALPEQARIVAERRHLDRLLVRQKELLAREKELRARERARAAPRAPVPPPTPEQSDDCVLVGSRSAEDRDEELRRSAVVVDDGVAEPPALARALEGSG